ncbi:MAG: PAS domain-containing protein [Oculatellaceae cyanobacterium bins.114]|nr:PAS domain-containing protein [Oculatellaceae cyanobacterium bins.114]
MASAQNSDSDRSSNSPDLIVTAEQVATLQAKNADLERQVQQLQQALAASEASHHASKTNLNGILNSAIAAIASFRAYQNREWHYEYLSSGCEVVFGYTPKEFLADPALWKSRIFPEDFTNVISPAIAQIFAGKPFQMEYRFYHKDGSLRWICDSITSERDEVTDSWLVTTVTLDVSERKQTEVELQRNRDFIERVTDGSPQLLYIFDLVQQRNFYINRQITAILGYTPEEIQAWGKQFFLDCLHPDDLLKVQQALQGWDSVPDGEYVELDYRLRHKNGSWCWLRSRDVVFERDETGAPTKILGTAVDISDRKQVEEALKLSEEQLRQIVENISDAFFLKDMASGQLIYTNSAYETMVGRSPQVFYDNPDAWTETIHPDDRAVIMAKYQREKQGVSFFDDEYRRVHADGSIYWVRDRTFPIRDEHGNIYRCAGVVRDITERKQLELALQASEAKLNDILNSATAAICSLRVDETGSFEYEYMSSGSKAVFGYTADEFVSDKTLWRSRVFPEDLGRVLPPDQITQEITDIVPYRFYRKDGSLRWLSNHIKVRRDEATHTWLMTIIDIDIHDRKMVAIALEESEAKLSDILNNAGAAITRFRLFTHLKWVYEFYSSGSETIFGYSVDELMNTDGLWLSCVHPDDLQQVHLPALQDLYAERSATIEFRFRQKDGSWRWISETASSKRDDAADCWIVTCVATDISDRKRAEEALRQSEQIFRQAFETSAFGISLRSPDGQYLRVNQTFCQILGYTEAELLTLTYRDVTHPDDLAIAPNETLHKLIAGDIPYYHLEKRFLHKQGHIVWGLISMSVVRDLQQQPLYFVTQIQDITVRKQLELALQASETKLNNILNNTIAAISSFRILANYDYKYDYWSDGCEAIYGYNAQELMNDKYLWISRVHPDDVERVIAAELAAILAESTLSYEFRFYHKDGSLRWISVELLSKRDEAANCWVANCVDIDITERKQAEAALRLSEEQLRQIIENIPDVFFLKDVATGGLIYLNSAYETLYGRSRQSLYDNPDSWTESIHPDDFAHIQTKYQEELQQFVFFDDEYRLTRPDGSIRWIWDRTFPIRDDQGKIYRYAGVNRDITNRKQLELALQASEAKLDDILNSAIAAISSFRVFANRDWNYEYWSHGSETIYGYTPQELMADQQLWVSRIHPDDLETIILPGYANIFAASTFSLEFRFYHKDGTLRWISGAFISRRDDHNNCWVVTVVNIDTTDRKQAEIALRHSREELRLITNSLPACIAYFDAEQRYRFVNNTYEQWFGYPTQAILGKHIREVIGERAYALTQHHIQQVLTGQTVQYEMEKPYTNGTRYVSAMLVPNIDPTTTEVQGCYALITDISDRKQFEKQLQKSLREKEILLTEIHHRVKNNLQVISSLLDLQANRSQDMHIQTALKISQDRILSMALVHEALYRFEQFAEMNFATYAEGLVNHLLSGYASPGQTVIVNLDIDPSITIALDQAVPCGLILNELVTNVMKYGCRDGEPGHLYVQLERVTESNIQLTVGNDGDTLPKDFSISKDVSIGFTLVQVLTDQLKGKFDIDRDDSPVGDTTAHRTLFKVTFPHHPTSNLDL